MEALASEDATECPAESPATPLARPRKVAVGFQFDNLRGKEEPRKRPVRAAIAVPPYSRIVYRAGSVSIK
jgi:hypothetical protein